MSVNNKYTLIVIFSFLLSTNYLFSEDLEEGEFYKLSLTDRTLCDKISSLFELEVSKDSFQCSEWVYVKFDFNPRVDSKTREIVANFLYCNKLSYTIYLRYKGRDYWHELSNREVMGDGGSLFMTFMGVKLNPKFGFPIYAKFGSGNIARTLRDVYQNRRDDFEPQNSSVEFQIVARPYDTRIDVPKVETSSADIFSAVSTTLTTSIADYGTRELTDEGALDQVLKLFIRALDGDFFRNEDFEEFEKRQAKLVALVDELDALSLTKSDFVRGYYLHQTINSFLIRSLDFDSSGALARRIERLEKEIGIRYVTYRDPRLERR
ncbi:MAG: hypothetical protein IJM30_12715 [Thermoguttaceae bacterium]|nr:hypothetical protein [Thermoguttaceae bacterium]